MSKDNKFKQTFIIELSGVSKFNDLDKTTFAQSLFSQIIFSLITAWNSQHKTTKAIIKNEGPAPFHRKVLNNAGHDRPTERK